MASKVCCLRQHIRNEPTNLTLLDLSLDDNVIKYFIRGPNSLDGQVQEAFELFENGEIGHKSGSLAVLYTQNGFAFLEALTDDVFVESLGHNFNGLFAHAGMKVRASNKSTIPSALQLLPGQSFYLGKTTLSLVPEEHRELPIQSSSLPNSNFESYNQQVSQISTPQRTARASSTIMETPVVHKDHESENPATILEQITGHAILGRKDSRKWPPSPSKREVMRTVRDASEPGHSNPQFKIEREDGLMADTAINDLGPVFPQPEVKIEDNMVDATLAKPQGECVVDLKDPETASADLGSGFFEQSEQLPLKSRVRQEGEPGFQGDSRIVGVSELLSPPGVRVRPEDESGTPSHSPTLAGSNSMPLPVERVQYKRRSKGSDEPPSLQARPESSPQSDHDADDAPVQKKRKIESSHEAVNEESQDSLRDEVISVEGGIPAPTDHSVSLDRASSKFQNPTAHTEPKSGSKKRSKRRSPAPLSAPKRTKSTIDSDSRSNPGDRLPSESSFNSTGPKPHTPHSDWNTISASPSNSVEPQSSMRSTRSTARDEQMSSSTTPAGIRIVFASSSSAGESKPLLKFLSSKGVKMVKSVHDCTVLCVGKELKKTSKVILAVLLGKDIVTDGWVRDSVKGDDLLSMVPYIARDTEKEAEWGTTLEQAIYRGKRGVKVLQDHSVYFTPSVKKELGKNGLDELREIAKCAGATSVTSALPKRTPAETPSAIVVMTDGDSEAAELQKLGWRAFGKDIISLSVLRGKLDLESDEFLIKEEKKESRKRKR